MTDRWALLLRPSANRVYADASLDLMGAELGVLDAHVLGGVISDLVPDHLGGVPYLTFAADLDDLAIARLSVLSTLYALFRQAPDGGLHPVTLRPLRALDEDLLTIQKYAGKTNELFTQLLLNVTLWASAAGADVHLDAVRQRPIRVLDPLCGRGTTLHQALVHGCDADGVDLDGRDFDAHEAFLKSWLRRKRLKHTAEVTPVRREGQHLGRRLDVEVAADPDDWKAGHRRRLSMVNADTTRAADVFRNGSYDVVVTDAPYGVQHGATAGGALQRSPVDLLGVALPGWVRLLRPGGALGIAWNTHVAPRETVLDLLVAAGLEPLDEGPWRGFRHRVDQAIDRDVIVARLGDLARPDDRRTVRD